MDRGSRGSAAGRRIRAVFGGVLAGLVLLGCAASPGAGPQPAPPPRTANAAVNAAVNSTLARLRLYPGDAQSPDVLAAAYLQKVRDNGDPSYYAKAEALLTRALQDDPNDADAMVLMGSLCLGRHQFREALDWGQKARAQNAYDARALGVIGDARIELGEYPEAIDAFQKMVDLRPDLGSYARVSYARELYGDVPGAIAAMRMAIEAGGPVPENVAYTEVLLGTLYFNRGDLDQAEAQYQIALQELPNYPRALAGLASVRAARGDYAAATSLYQRAIDLYPLPEFVIAKGDVEARAGDAAKARQTYDLAAAEEQLYQANGVDVDAELALFDADHQRELPNALAAARRAMRDRPSVVSADVLAWTLYQTGDLNGALAASEQAERLGTQNALFYYHSGRIKAALGQVEAARADLQKALAINPSFSILHADDARQTLASLESHR